MPLMVRLALVDSEGVLTESIGLTGKKEGKTRLMNMVMQVSHLIKELSSVLLNPKL
jgi:hypothetical protein